LLFAARVGETEVDKLDVFVFDELNDVGHGFTHNLSPDLTNSADSAAAQSS
jgi:hypothetical protein